MPGWTAPKTWVSGALSSADLNTHVRDNLLWLKSQERVIGRWTRRLTGTISAITIDVWNQLNSNGLEVVTLGAVQGGSILNVDLALKCENEGGSFFPGIIITDGSDILATYVGTEAIWGDVGAIHITHIFPGTVADAHVYAGIKPTLVAGVLAVPAASDDNEVVHWMDVTMTLPAAAYEPIV